jgi:hypothetical protein
MNRWLVYWWDRGNRFMIVDKYRWSEVLLCANPSYFVRIRPPSRMPKTLVFLGEL